MAPILLRVCRRKTAFERDDTPIEEKLLAEFKRDGKPDLRPSVYEIEPDGDLVVQTRAEHSASAGAYPQRGTNIDFSGASQILRTAGDSRFRMTQEAHREVVFESQEQLLQFLEEQISSNLAVRQHATTKPQLIGYVKGRIAEKDEEWLSFCRDGKKRHHWGCLEVASPAPTPAQVGGPIHKRLFTKLQEVFLAVRRLWR